MATTVRRGTSKKQVVRFKRKRRISSKIQGTAEKPRLAVFRSNRHLYVQLVDDVKGHTLVSACTGEEELKATADGTVHGAKALGGAVAKRALAKSITEVKFDRSGYLYHGRVKAIADAAREGGLKF